MLHRWLILSVAMFLTTYIIPGFKVRGIWNTIVVAALFGVINALLGWFIITVMVIGTLGIALLLGFITRWIANAVILEIVAWLSPRVQIEGFGSALAASALISLTGEALEWFLRHRM